MYCMYLLSFVALPHIHSTCRRNVRTSSCLSFIIINHWLLSSHSFSLHSTRTCYVSCVLAMWHFDTMYYYIIAVPYNCSRSNIVVDGTTNIDTTLEEVWLHRTRSVNCFSSPSFLFLINACTGSFHVYGQERILHQWRNERAKTDFVSVLKA